MQKNGFFLLKMGSLKQLSNEKSGFFEKVGQLKQLANLKSVFF